MRISRRDFLKYCTVSAGALGLSAGALFKLKQVMAKAGGLRVIWLAGQACTGCSTSLLNSVYYQTIQELLLLGEASQTLDISMHETLMASMSNEATQQADLTSSDFALVVEGAVTPLNGYCQIGSYIAASSDNMSDVVTYLAGHSNCKAILAVGTCASYGGIPAAAGNVTKAKGVLSHLGNSYRRKIINIPGCPPNPNWIVGTVAYLLANGLSFPQLDSLRRPRTYYGERICNSCDRFATSKSGGQRNGFVGIGATGSSMVVSEPNRIGDPAQNSPGGRCLKKAGCKGSRTKSDCSLRKWHSPGFGQVGVNWCVGAGAPCQGCTQNNFPDQMSPFYYIR